LHFIFHFKLIHQLIERDIKAGIIKPLKANVFNASQVEEAFRFMASGKHIGKVMLKIRKNMFDSHSLPIEVVPRVNCDSEKSYVIVGGLGGFGLELADWLVNRGCRNIVLSSSRGISNAYQELRIK
jgi:fatty acid synthase, animal type